MPNRERISVTVYPADIRRLEYLVNYYLRRDDGERHVSQSEAVRRAIMEECYRARM